MANYLMRLRLIANRIQAAWRATVVPKKQPGQETPGVSRLMRDVVLVLLLTWCLIVGVDVSTIPWLQGILMT